MILFQDTSLLGLEFQKILSLVSINQSTDSTARPIDSECIICWEDGPEIGIVLFHLTLNFL